MVGKEMWLRSPERGRFGGWAPFFLEPCSGEQGHVLECGLAVEWGGENVAAFARTRGSRCGVRFCP
jgi:hypothetical protein